MRILRLALRWGLPPLLALGGFALGYAVFFPELASSSLTDGSAASFHDTADKISKGNLLEKASPLERVAWLLEVCKQPKSLRRDHALFETIQQLQPGDFLAAVADVRELSRWFSSLDGKLRTEVIEAVIERWMDVDPDGLLRWLPIAQRIVDSGTLNLPQMGEQDLGAMYGVLARRSPGWAFEQINGLGPKMRPEVAVKALIKNAVLSGSPLAEQWLASFKNGPHFNAALASYVEAVAATDPERAFNKLSAEAPQNRVLPARIVEIAAMRMPTAAIALLDRLDGSDRNHVMWTIPSMVAANSNFDVAAWLDREIEKNPALLKSEENPTLAYAVGGMAMRDPAKALEWVQKLPEAPREKLAQTAFGYWSSSDPKALLEWLTAHPQYNSSLGEIALERLANHSPELFAKWLSGLPASANKQQAQLNGADQLLYNRRLDEALELFPKDLAGKNQAAAAQQFGFRAGTMDLTKATRWLETLQSVPLQQSATQGVVERWMLDAPAATAAWADGLPAGTLRDSAAGAIATNVADRDFEAANQWLSQVSNEQLRNRFITDLYYKRYSQSPAQAVTWLRSLSGMSETVRNRLLNSRP